MFAKLFLIQLLHWQKTKKTKYLSLSPYLEKMVGTGRGYSLPPHSKEELLPCFSINFWFLSDKCFSSFAFFPLMWFPWWVVRWQSILFAFSSSCLLMQKSWLPYLGCVKEQWLLLSPLSLPLWLHKITSLSQPQTFCCPMLSKHHQL